MARPRLGRTRRPRALPTLAALAFLLLAGGLVATSFGSVAIPLGKVAGVLLGRLPFLRLAPTWSPSDEAIILQIRLPRVVAALVVGGGLAAAGTIFQGLLRNPMADPYIIGTSGGAALGATIAVTLVQHLSAVFLGFSLVSLAAFLGAMAAVLVVYRLARVGARTPMTTLLLSGFALSSFLAALMSFLMLVKQEALRRVVLWTMGGLSSATWPQLAVAGPLVAAGVLVSIFFSLDLNAFLLGDEEAANLGVPVEQRKFLLLMLGALLTGVSVSLSGLVGFVGLVVPHVGRLLLGPDHRLLLPASALMGGLFLVLCDLAARLVLAPAELPVGIVTALCGAPFFIYLLRRTRKEYTF